VRREAFCARCVCECLFRGGHLLLALVALVGSQMRVAATCAPASATLWGAAAAAAVLLSLPGAAAQSSTSCYPGTNAQGVSYCGLSGGYYRCCTNGATCSGGSSFNCSSAPLGAGDIGGIIAGVLSMILSAVYWYFCCRGLCCGISCGGAPQTRARPMMASSISVVLPTGEVVVCNPINAAASAAAAQAAAQGAPFEAVTPPPSPPDSPRTTRLKIEEMAGLPPPPTIYLVSSTTPAPGQHFQPANGRA
jgi:hypothetical protein